MRLRKIDYHSQHQNNIRGFSMTPFEAELLQSTWPLLSSALGGVAVALGGVALSYLKTLSKSQSDISASIASMKERMTDVEVQIKTDLADFKQQVQHRIDRVIGSADTRMGNMETRCSMQHGMPLRRRAEDWAQESDVSGDKKHSSS